jgi:hypothetical protein
MKIIYSFGKELYGLNITQTTLLPLSRLNNTTLCSHDRLQHQKSCNFQYLILKHTFIVKYFGNLKYIKPKTIVTIIIEFCAFVCNSVMLLKAYLTKYICCLWTTDSTTRFPAPQSQNKLPSTSWTWIIHTQLSHFAKTARESARVSLPPRFNAILGHKSGRGFRYFFLPFPSPAHRFSAVVFIPDTF